MTISKSRSVPFGWSGEEQKSVSGLYNKILIDQFAQAIDPVVVARFHSKIEDVAALFVGEALD